ncbi:MAG: conjugal transfer protein TraX [Lachnospiraceae bacterium]|nr:conjugal transfer protein TraX [Lachnospiraceae bacterium]
MSTFTLKIIAIISMAIDHAGLALFPELRWMRFIGRIAFPIYCFLIVEGAYNTRDEKKYLERMLAFAVLSEIPFNLVLSHKMLYFGTQNVFFTLSIGLAMIIALRKYKNDFYLQVICVIAALGTAEVLKTDYSWRGVMLILLFYLGRDAELVRNIGLMEMFFKVMSASEPFASFALIPISLYNGKKGPGLKYLFYLFYPVHLLVIYFIWRYMN